MPAKTASHPGVVSANEAYILRELYERFGIGRKWLRKAREAGLRLTTLGRHRAVRGAELLRYMETTEGESTDL